MTATSPEQNSGASQVSELDTIKVEVARQSAVELLEEVKKSVISAREIKTKIENSLRTKGGLPDKFDGDVKDKDSAKGKAHDVKRIVQKILIASKTPDKIPATPADKPSEAGTLSHALIRQLGERLIPEDITDQTAPYIHSIIHNALSGNLTSVEGMYAELSTNQALLQAVSPEIYKRVQDVFVHVAQEQGGLTEIEARRKFGLKDDGEEEDAVEKGMRDGIWDQTFSSYFNPGDRPLVESLYTPSKFIHFVEGLKEETAAQMGKDKNSAEVGVSVSKEIERRIVELFGKLYTRLDHEKPSEFFQAIEQEDVMRGILPVKNELKRRITLLSAELDLAEKGNKIHDPGLFTTIEIRPDIADIEYTGTDKEKHIKPRLRLNPFTKPHKSQVSHYVHYLDQIVDHYIEARRYTHNARAVFLHPVDHEKGFYSQLAHFAEEMTTVDFDQMMALPDNEIFRDAFALYDKHVEEAFAANDWRHSPVMFELKQNSVHTQIEEDVLQKLKIMYRDRGDMTDARLEAALSMAVGASRGMFLNEIEKAAYADPHLTEDGKATFASYYNQDASALVTLNPMHQHFRWQAPNTMDPILFMPIKGFREGANSLTDHRTLYKKMQAYRDSFISGRTKELEGETLFSDFLVNVGKVGGPLQRKGWRTGNMFEPLYVRDETETSKFAYDYVKTWARFENIGYEVVQDFVAKLPDSIKGQYAGKHGGDAKLLRQKNDLFKYIYTKYFDEDPDGLGGYLKDMRKTAERKIIHEIKEGKIAPKDIKEQIEIEVSEQFLHRALARVVAQRIPSKLLRMDRDRLSKNGTSRWRQISIDMGLSTAQFDDLMKDMLMAEQLLRKDVSKQMRDMLDAGKKPWEWGNIEYRLTERRLEELLKGKITDAARITQLKDLLSRTQKAYGSKEFLDGWLTPFLKNGEYKFSFAVDEADMSFIPWRGAGSRVLSRAISDMSMVEKNVSNELIKLPKVLQQMAIDGKHDFTPVIEIMTKAYGALDGIIGTEYAHEVVHNIAALTINYFKKDTRGRVAYGIFGWGRKNSLAAERAGGSVRVWEWESPDIDKFCYALESRALLPKEPFSPVNSKPEYTPIYLDIPFIKKPVKLPQSMKIFGKEIKLFQKRKADFKWTSKQLRNQYGGRFRDIAFDVINKYLPFVIAWLIFKYMKDALEESEGKKKK